MQFPSDLLLVKWLYDVPLDALDHAITVAEEIFIS